MVIYSEAMQGYSNSKQAERPTEERQAERQQFTTILFRLVRVLYVVLPIVRHLVFGAVFVIIVVVLLLLFLLQFLSLFV